MASPQGVDPWPKSGKGLRALWDWIRPLRHWTLAALGRAASRDPMRATRLTELVSRGMLRAGMMRAVARIYPGIPGNAAAREEVVVRWAKSHIVRRIVESGSADRLTGMARWANPELLSSALARRRPIILIYPYSDLMSLLHSRAHELGVPVAVIRNEGPERNPRSVRFATRPEPTAEGRALMLLKARAQLRAGGAVMVALHAQPSREGEEGVIQGRHVTLPLGLFTLARLTGAEVFPVVPRWTSASQVEFSVRESLPSEPGDIAPDVALLREAMAWLDRHLTLEPLDLSFATHLWISRSPVAPPDARSRS